MSNFNLHINDYNINELKDLLNLVDPYTLEDIVNNENELREKLLMDKNVSNDKKKTIDRFLQTTKAILIKLKKKEFVNLPSDELIGTPNHPVPKRVQEVVEKINAVPRDDTTESGVSKNTIHKLLCLDSRFRDNYYTTLSTNYIQTLPTVVKNVVSMELSSLEFPTTYYQMSKGIGNNFFWLHWACPVRTLLAGLLPDNPMPLPPLPPLSSPLNNNNPNTLLPYDVCAPPVTVGSIYVEHDKSSTTSNFDPQQLWYYIAIPDGNYQRQAAMRAINEQLKIATQPTTAVRYLFKQLGAYYTDPGIPGSGWPVPPTQGVAWVPDGDIDRYVNGYCAYPQITIDEASTKTVLSYTLGNARWSPSIKCGSPYDCAVPDSCAKPKPWMWPDKIKFAFTNKTVQEVLEAVNFIPSGGVEGDIAACNAWLSVYFNKDTDGNGSTPYGTVPNGTDSRYSGGQVKEPSLDLRADQGIVGNFGWILGYRLGYYQGATAYVSEGCYDAWGVKYLYVIVNDFNKNVNNFCIPSYNESLGRTNVLARITTTGVSSDEFTNGLSLTNNINTDTTIRKRYYFGPVDVSKLELQITDEFGRILNLNNMDYSMAINLICLYD